MSDALGRGSSRKTLCNPKRHQTRVNIRRVVARENSTVATKPTHIVVPFAGLADVNRGGLQHRPADVHLFNGQLALRGQLGCRRCGHISLLHRPGREGTSCHLWRRCRTMTYIRSETKFPLLLARSQCEIARLRIARKTVFNLFATCVRR